VKFKKALWLLLPFIFAFTGGYYYFTQLNRSWPLLPATSPSPTATAIFENPPIESLIGQITSKAGDISWVSRTATASAKLTDVKPVLQGEEYETGDSGTLSVLFPNILSVEMLPKSKVKFAQTLPQNLVLVQMAGTVNFKQEGTNIISIRALGILIRENSAEVKVTIDAKSEVVAALVLKGTITVAYEDLNHTSYLKNIASGEQLTFDDTTRTVIVN